MPRSPASIRSRRVLQSSRIRCSASAATDSAAIAASCMKPGSPKSMHMASDSACLTRSRGPTSHPARNPGNEWDFERLPRVTTRSGSVAARLGTRPPGASPAYTSSETSHRSCRRAISAMAFSSFWLMITPLGLEGVVHTMARVRGETRDSSTPMSGRKPAPVAARTIRAPETSIVAGYVAYIGSNVITSSPGPARHIDATNSAFCAPARYTTFSCDTACPVRALCAAAIASRSLRRPDAGV